MHDDDFHSAAKPMDSMQGGMFEPHSQAPNTSENVGNSRPQSDASGPGWNSQFHGAKPGLSGTNDKNKAH